MTVKEKEDIRALIAESEDTEVKGKVIDYINSAEINVDELETLGNERDIYKQQAEDYKSKYEDLKEKYVKRIITPSGDKIEYEREKEEVPQIFEEEEIIK